MSTTRNSLDQARADLAAIEEELAALDATKSEASKTTAAFTKWRTAYGAANAERERLMIVIEGLELAVAAEESANASEGLLRRYEAKAAANEKLAARIKADLAWANGILLRIVRDVAAAAAEDAEINAGLPEGIEPLLPADFIARGRPGLDRKELEKRRVWLWTNTRNGALIGDQDSVVDRGNGLGRIGAGAYVTNCVSALFEQIEYFPAEPAERPQALWQLRLPQPDGPGLVFDGAKCNYPADVIAELARSARVGEPRERPIETELRPAPSIAADEGVAA
jgi:hypothetical protein